jgi:hypothetical protein
MQSDQRWNELSVVVERVLDPTPRADNKPGEADPIGTIRRVVVHAETGIASEREPAEVVVPVVADMAAPRYRCGKALDFCQRIGQAIVERYAQHLRGSELAKA